ncbi:hypothetical protein B0T14DRAFT_211795 [Immersiella caudata]|uniref:Protein kinase domain-containing protein n=1 Tax=Immersiella caudata TaxID=314043 RepID=A0AA40C004_9PEZI|nr:hypothetical protein B0T14DRAFT_211795 [Immersiella caudata]
MRPVVPWYSIWSNEAGNLGDGEDTGPSLSHVAMQTGPRASRSLTSQITTSSHLAGPRYLRLLPTKLITMRLFSSFRKGTVELKKLREEILSSIEYSGIGGNAFRPAGQVDKFLAVDRVSIILSRKASDVLVEFVCQNAKKIFLALVLCGDACSANDLASIMQSCHVYGMSDEQLPVPEMSCIGIGGSGHCLTKHNSSLDVLHDGRWRAIMYRFRVDQYTINPPVFNDEGLVYKLAAGCVLPFISNDLNKRDGHHFTVVEAILHQDHYVTVCDGSRAASQKPVRVALNKMKHLDGELRYNAREAWGREVAALKEIRGFGHKHFVRFLAAMEHGSECYAMFEWADGGSLRDVWKNDGAEYLTADRVICVLEELLGLAGALATLHNKNKTTAELASRATPRELRDRPGANRPPRPAVSSPSIRQPVRAVLLQLPKIHVQRDRSEDEFDIYSDMDRRYISDDIDLDQEVHWRHGDLSPDKILHCKDTSADRWLGTLKIAGLGRAKQHFMATSQRYEQTQQRYIASQYEAPEAMANLWSPRSRRYDIWSMGCIFLEFVIFLLYGSKGLDAFYGERESKQISTGTLYFTLTFDQDTAEVSGTAKYWINSILQESECCREGSAIADLVVLIRDRLLVVDLPESTMKQDQRDVCRADAGELQSRLEKIWKMALDSEAKGGNYLLAQPIRAHSLIPRPSGVEDRKFGRDGVNYWKVPGREQQKYQV